MTPALSVINASKTFGATKALDGVSFDVAPGEIRALVGQNGCGKSTLIKILAGFHAPDPGTEVLVDGRPLAFVDAVATENAGLRFVHQDLGLVANLDVVDNMALGVGYERGPLGIKWKDVRASSAKALADLGYDIDVRRHVGTLAMSERTAVAIARALSSRGSETSMLILDEPTANLPAAEAQRLYDLVHRVADRGIAVMFVSHHFDEVFELAQSVTVLRDGRLIVTRPVEGLTEDELISLVIGRSLASESRVQEQGSFDRTVLNVNGVSGQAVHGATFDVRAGEIVGVAGITGSGREELAGLVFGGLPRHGEVTVNGVTVPPSRPDESMSLGMGLVPAERHANASFLASTLRENVTLVDPSRHYRGGVLRRNPEKADVSTWLTKLDVRPANTEFTMAQLSGGNQQKVVMARWLRKEPEVLILDEPTQGVDVGAKADIHRLVDEAAALGTAVLVTSTDHEELVRLCHRVLVLRRGVIVAELTGDRLTSEDITAVTIGRDQKEAS